MKQRRYFDINCIAGRGSAPDRDYPIEIDELISDMAYYRVHGAAVMARNALDYAFTEGNDWIINESKAYNGRIFAVAALPATAVLEAGEDYLDRLHKSGVRAFAACPAVFRCTVDPRDMRKIAEFMISRGIPLILPAAQSPLTALSSLLDAYPELNVIVTDTSWGDSRILYPMLDRYPNLHFDINANQANDILSITKQHFGIERALYGTSWPKKSMGAIKSLVEYAFISERDKDLVASENACRLLGIDSADLSLYEDSDCQLDEIAGEADLGQPISVPVFDSHTHVVPAEHKTVSGLVMLNSDCDNIVKKMDALGIDSVITAPWQGITTDGRAGNAQTLYAARKYPGRFFGFSTCNINYTEDLAGWRSCHDENPDVFVGIKPYWPYQKFDIASPVLTEWYEYANSRRLLLLLHTGNAPVVDKAAELSLKYPDIKFILAHTGIDYNVARKNVSVAKQRRNVYLEITYTSVTRGMIEYLVSEVGADKVLYGSDLPMRDPAPQLGWVCYARISTGDKRKILAGNIKRLLSDVL